MKYKDRIISDYKTMLGKPVIKGTRITVELILRKLSQGAGIDDVLQSYPRLTREDIFASLEYASDVLKNEEVIEVSR